MSQTGADDSEVVFEQPGKSAEVMEQEGLIPSRHKEETWLEDTQPHHGAQRSAMEFDQPVDEELGAALGGVEDKDRSHDDGVQELRPEQQIQNEEEIRTRHVGNHVEWRVFHLRDLGRGGTNRFRVRGTWRHSELIQLPETDHTASGHRWKHWKAQCLECNGT